MRLNRSFGSLFIGTIDNSIKIFDGFAASGIRGLRYALENNNVKRVIFNELKTKAKEIIERNAIENKLTNYEILIGDFNKVIFDPANDANFIEIDPFGSPVEFLSSAFYNLKENKEAYLSITATDVAVLCGENTRAARKKYRAKNLRNEFTHEVGARILIKRIVEVGAIYDMAVFPLCSLSHRHYIKVFVKTINSASLATKQIENFGFVSYCFICGYREVANFPVRKCKICGSIMDYGGELWLGNLHDKEVIKKMIKLNEIRNYSDKKEIEKILKMMINEDFLFYFDIHRFSSIFKKNVPKLEKIINKLESLGFKASRTHFNKNAIKTDAPYEEILKIIKNGPTEI